MTSNPHIRNGSDDEGVVLRDLQSLLRKSLGEEIMVEYYTTSVLVPTNENYGTRTTEVNAMIRTSETSSIRKLSLVATLIPTAKFQKEHFNYAAAFSKEMFFYETLIPGYVKLQKEERMYEGHVSKISPKYYGGRLNMNEIAPDVVDNDVVLLLENLKIYGYYTISKYCGMNFKHAIQAVKALAKFHALGMAVKVKKPKLFEAAKKCFDVKYDWSNEGLSNTIDHLVNTVCKNPIVAKYKEKIKSNLEENNWNVWLWPIEQIEPWMTIIHGDFWVHNILLHQVTGNLDDVKFIHFQLAKVGSPQADLIYFLCGSLDNETMKNNFDDLLAVYYRKLIETLYITGVDTSILTRKSFEQQLQKVARTELFHCLMSLKFFTYKTENDFDFNDKNSIMLSNANELFETRATTVVLIFIEKNWL